MSDTRIAIEYIAPYRYFRLKKMGLNVFVYNKRMNPGGIGLHLNGNTLIDHDIRKFLSEHDLDYDKIIELVEEPEEWSGTLEELKKAILK